MKYIALTSFFTEDRDYQKGDIYLESDFIDQNQIDEFVSLNYIEEYTGGTGGTDNYQALNNKPKINGVTLDGNKSSSDLLIPTPINYQAGAGIDITGNVISATGGGGGATYTAGDNIQISADDVISATDTTYTAGENITITSTNAINAIIDLTDYYNKTEVDDILSALTTVQMEIVSTLPATGQSNVIYLLETATNNYEQYVYSNSNWVHIGDTSVDLSNYVTIPMMNDALSNKQNKLVAGDNIAITNDNKISAVDTKYYAGTNISINSGNVISATTQKYTGGDNVTITNTGVINAVDTKYQAGEGMKLTGTTFSSLPYVGSGKINVNSGRIITVDLSDYYNKSQIAALLENLDSVSLKVVLDLPAIGEKNVIYLVKAGEEHFYNQWIYSDNEWYNIGTTEINLDNYYTKAQTNDLLDEKQDFITPTGAMVVVDDQSVLTSIDWGNNTASDVTAEDLYEYNKSKMDGAISLAIENDFTGNRALVSTPMGKISYSNITHEELNQLSGVTDNIQSQLDSKQDELSAGTRITSVTDTTDISKVDLTNKEVTPMTAKVLFDYMWKKIYPVGSIYITMSLTSPATLFGGTWERIQDRFLLATGSTYNVVNTTGGASTVTLTRANLPNVSVTTSSAGETKIDNLSGAKCFTYKGGGVANKWGLDYGTKELYESSSIGKGLKTANAHTHSFNLNNNVTQTSVNKMPPYITVNVWRRTA